MTRFLTVTTVLALIFPTIAVGATDISGTWQADSKPQRVLMINKTAHGYGGALYNLGQEAPMMPRYDGISTIILSGTTVSFSMDKAQGRFEGTLSEDGKTIAGVWKMLYGPPSQSLAFARTAKKDEWVIDPSPHKARFVTVQPNVKLDVLDWGGNGPPLIFLSGLYGTGHSFDGFAEKFTGKHHVYAITRRGFGASDAPPPTNENYDSDRLGDDVLAVMDVLHIQKPVLVGHSIAGQELSSVGTRHPEKIAGLIYLDSLFQYAFYDAQPSLNLDSAIVRRNLDRMFDLEPSASQWSALVKETQNAVSNLQQSLKDTADTLAQGGLEMPVNAQGISDFAANRIVANPHRYRAAPVPILAVLAMPRRCEPNCDKADIKRIMAGDAARADLFEKSAPDARVVRIAKASHFIWRSNEAQVEQEMNAFLDGLAH